MVFKFEKSEKGLELSRAKTTLEVCSHKENAHPFNLFEFEQNVRTAFGLSQNIRSGDKTKGDFSLFKY